MWKRFADGCFEKGFEDLEDSYLIQVSDRSCGGCGKWLYYQID